MNFLRYEIQNEQQLHFDLSSYLHKNTQIYSKYKDMEKIFQDENILEFINSFPDKQNSHVLKQMIIKT